LTINLFCLWQGLLRQFFVVIKVCVVSMAAKVL
jgi:hypothetical protein